MTYFVAKPSLISFSVFALAGAFGLVFHKKLFKPRSRRLATRQDPFAYPSVRGSWGPLVYLFAIQFSAVFSLTYLVGPLFFFIIFIVWWDKRYS